MKKSKYYFTLIEVMVSLCIVSILLGVIFNFFSQLTRCEKKMRTVQEKVLNSHNFRVRLNNIFSQIEYKNFSKTPFFYTQNEELFFQFDNGLDPNPLFSSSVFAKIYIDKKNNLVLQTKPCDAKSNISREEILMQNIQSLSFEFLEKLPPQKACQKIFYNTSYEWDKTKKNLPASVTIKLKTTDGNDSPFTFFLPSPQAIITYYQTK